MPVGLRSPANGLAKIPERAIRRQLHRVLASTAFNQADRLTRFISFIVHEGMAGRGGELKEYVIGVHVFDKEPLFDPRTDPIVRVEARRLRAHLVRYYLEDGRHDELIIDVPKGGYAPTFRRRDRPAPTQPSLSPAVVTRSPVAVLPFADHSTGAALGGFCRGLRDEIVHALTSLGALRVLECPDDAVGDAALIISGSVRRAGDHVRVTTHLLDGTGRYYLWSDSTDAALTNPIATQEAIARTVAARLEPELIGSAAASSGRHATENLAARNLYLQGRHQLNHRTEEGLHKAVELFEKALIEDVQYALAYSGLADAYELLAHYGAIGPAEARSRAAASAVSAVRLDGGSAEAHTSLAHVRATRDWDWTAAEEEYQRAILLNPRYPTARHWYAMTCLVPIGRLDEALQQILLAQSLDPVSPIIARDVAVIHSYRGDVDAALAQCDRTIELHPHFAPAYFTRGVIQEQRKDLDQSAAAFRRAVTLAPRSPRMQAALARTAALSGKSGSARDTIAQLEALAKARYVSPFDFGTIYLALRDVEQGYHSLARACDDRCFELLAVQVDPRFDGLRDDPRFRTAVRTVVRRVGVKRSATVAHEPVHS